MELAKLLARYRRRNFPGGCINNVKVDEIGREVNATCGHWLMTNRCNVFFFDDVGVLLVWKWGRSDEENEMGELGWGGGMKKSDEG